VMALKFEMRRFLMCIHKRQTRRDVRPTVEFSGEFYIAQKRVLGVLFREDILEHSAQMRLIDRPFNALSIGALGTLYGPLLGLRRTARMALVCDSVASSPCTEVDDVVLDPDGDVREEILAQGPKSSGWCIASTYYTQSSTEIVTRGLTGIRVACRGIGRGTLRGCDDRIFLAVGIWRGG
jgi:hypothetical protein